MTNVSIYDSSMEMIKEVCEANSYAITPADFIEDLILAWREENELAKKM